MPLFAFHNTTRTPEEADTMPIRRRSTTISMMEEEFGIRTPPRDAGRFGENNTRLFQHNSPSLTTLTAKGIPSKLWILPPKRRHTTTQAPEPRRSSLLTGSWETMRNCDAEG